MIEQARVRQRRQWLIATVVAVGVLGIALAVGLRGGERHPVGGREIADQPLRLAVKNRLAYENGTPIRVGISPDFGAGTVSLDVNFAGHGVGGADYPTSADPAFGPGASGFGPERQVGPDGEIDILLTGPTVASLHVKHLGSFKPVRILGLLAGDQAFVFYRPPGSPGTVLGPGIRPHVL